MKIFFSVGEPSGDIHGANLIRELHHADSSIEFVGYGGPKMKEAGLDSHGDLTKFAVMFFWQVLGRIRTFYSLYKKADKYFSDNEIDAVVLIDYPGFNWWIAKAAKRHGIQVFYYGVPQMWAWAPWRIRKLRKRVDHVICKLPFEKKWFEKRNCNAHFVGHPYFDELGNQEFDKDFVDDFSDSETKLLTLLPGSRDQEVKSNLPWMLESAARVQEQVDDVSVVISCFSEEHSKWVRQQVQLYDLPFDVMHTRTPELISMSDVCLACSGSVSLELMYHRKPSVIVYRLSPFQWLMKSIFLRVPYITLVNLLYLKDLDQEKTRTSAPHSRRVPYPEFPRVNNPSEAMAKHLARWLQRSDAYLWTLKRIDEAAEQFKSEHDSLETNLASGASSKAASTILEALGHSGVSAIDQIGDQHVSQPIEHVPVRRAA